MAATAELKAMATLDGRQFESEVAKIKRKTSDFAGALSGIKGLVAGAFSVGAVVGFAKSLLNAADSLTNASDALGVGVENLQALRAAAAEAGLGVQGMDDALGRITRAQAEALAGNDQFRDSFAALGVTMEQIQGQSPDKVLELIARGLVASGNSAEATAAVFDILGKSSARAMGMLNTLGTEGLDATRQKFTELGLVMEESVVNSLDRAEERLNRFYEKVKAKTASVIVKIVDEFAFVGGLIGAGMEGVSGEQMAAYDAQMAAPAASAAKEKIDTPIAKSAREVTAEKQAATDATRLARLSEELMVSRMSLEERRVYLNEQLAELAKQEVKTDADKAAQIEKQLALEGKLKQVRDQQISEHEKGLAESTRISTAMNEGQASIARRRADLEKNVGMSAPSVDAMKRIGGFIGGESDPMVAVAERQLRIEEEMRDYLKYISERVSKQTGVETVFTE